MVLTVDNRMREILKNEAAKALIEEFWPGATENPKLKLAANMPFRNVLTYFPEPPSEEIIEKFNARLAEIE